MRDGRDGLRPSACLDKISNDASTMTILAMRTFHRSISLHNLVRSPTILRKPFPTHLSPRTFTSTAKMAEISKEHPYSQLNGKLNQGLLNGVKSMGYE